MATATPFVRGAPLQPHLLPPPSQQSLPLPTSPDPASMAVTTTLLIFYGIVILCFFSVFARRFLADNTHTPYALRYPAARSFRPLSATSGMDPSVVRALPVVSYNGKTAAAECVVCLSEFEERERVKVIPACRHLFHPWCIDKWLVARGSCPVCRCSEVFGSRWRGGDACFDVYGGGDEVEGGEELEGKVVGKRRSRSWCCRDRRTAALRRTSSL